jgi:acid stress-induced BolA-like protein IbaG/YrbA
MKCLAALDHVHLDNVPFLMRLAQSVSNSADYKPLFIHGDNDHTEQIIQQGIMRNKAEIQCIKTLNHRLVGLFADEGVSALGIHAYQKKAISLKHNQLQINQSFFESLPPVPIILSTLAWDEDKGSSTRIKLPKMVNYIHENLSAEPVYCFSLQEKMKFGDSGRPIEKSWDSISENFKEEHIPREFRNYNHPLRLIPVQSFGRSCRKGEYIHLY